MINVPRHPAPLDHLLAAAGSLLAVYSAGQSIGRPAVGFAMAGFVVAASVLGLLLGRASRGRRWAGLDGYLLFAGALAALTFARPLNAALPEGGYPWQLIFAGVFGWMLVFGAAAAWRDSTLCFLAVPSIAIFGLVGAFDTFRLAPFLFFVFLVCAATLFFRAHARSMMDQAEEALSAAEPRRGPLVRRRASRDVAAEAVQSGAWKWMAGPEWALGSALVIIFLSLLGAPVIQRSVQGVAGNVRIQLPQQTNPRPPAAIRNSPGEQPIGGGPASFRRIPVLKVEDRNSTYLRGRTYDIYTGLGWSSSSGQGAMAFLVDDPEAMGRPVDFDLPPGVAPGRRVTFDVTVVEGAHAHAYVPGNVVRFEGEALTARRNEDDSVETYPTLMRDMSYRGEAMLPARLPSREAARPPENVPNSDRYLVAARIPARVREFAEEAVRGATTDFERARRIKEAVEAQCAYNLRAPAVPMGRDPVDFFLFESQQGYCDLFASSVATMARAVGLPSRIATGYLVRSETPEPDGGYLVRDEDAHMWAEIHFEGIGWVTFDATEGAVLIDEEGRRTDRPDLPRLILSRALDVLPWAFVIAALVLGLIGLRNSSNRPRPGPRSQVGVLYQRFQASVERQVERPRRLGQTPREFLERSRSDLGELAPAAEALTDRFEVLLYGPEDPTTDELAELKREVEAFRRAERRAS